MLQKIIIGAGRQAAETFYLLEDIGLSKEVSAFAIDMPEPGQLLIGKPVLSISELLKSYTKAVGKPSILIGVGDTASNKRLAKLFSQAGFSFFNAIHKEVVQERQKYIGTGVIIATGSLLTCNISLGNHVIINIGCTISHDCVIGNHVNISPGSHLAGNVTVEDDVFIGTAATFIPKVTVGKGSIVAAGACVIKDVPPYSLVAGVPAVIRKRIAPKD